MEKVSEQKEKQIVPAASAVLQDGTMVEMIFRPDLRRTLLAIYSAGRWTLQDKVDLAGEERLVPFSPGNNLIKNEAVLLPSEQEKKYTEARRSWSQKYKNSSTALWISIRPLRKWRRITFY